MIGRVLEVHDERLGGEVAVSAVLDDTTLVLDDASDFDEFGGSVVGSTSLVSTYTGVDYDTNTLSGLEAMSVPVAAGLQAEDWVAPYSRDHEDTVRIAEVDVGDGPELVAVVVHALRTYLPPGSREPGEEEVVEVGEVGGEVQVLNIRGRVADQIILDLKVTENAAAAPPPGFLRIYAVEVGGFPQLRVKNSAGTTKSLTATDFTDGE
jgi:hypothetical protein